ncbi:MAG: DUF444 family protein [Caldilineaceae bacterium]|nr:DUF444 family protein [Caldilineaceae bacterium]
MPLPIEQDNARFKQIVRGKIRRNLRKYMSNGELIGRQGKDLVSIPVPQVDLPRFTFGNVGRGGVAQGPGQPGDPLSQADPGDGAGQAGDQPGQHILEVDVSLDELAQMLAEELELPRIEPKGQDNIESEKARYTDVRRVGPDSLRHFKRTYREALKRQVISGIYNPERPVIIPVREDMRYRSFQRKPAPEANAVIIYMMDVSGSMGDYEKRLVRLTAFWIDTWLKANYRKIERRYIVHDARAGEVDEHAFYHLRQSGGTMISSALQLCRQLIQHNFDPQDWNIYLFQFSDGENWDTDNVTCLELLSEHLLPVANLYCYGQVNEYRHSNYDGAFINQLARLEEPAKLVTARIPNPDAIFDALKLFLGKGR